MDARFIVEHAGCATCAERVRAALAGLGEVQVVEIDEADDSATVRVALSPEVSEQVVNTVLRNASAGSGHEYRVRDESWSVTEWSAL